MVEKIEKVVWRTSDGTEFETRKEAARHGIERILCKGCLAGDYYAEYVLPYAEELISLLQQYVEASDE